MNRETRRKVEKANSTSQTRSDKIESERGRQTFLREQKAVVNMILPYMTRKERELVPRPIRSFCQFLNGIIAPLKKFIGHLPPLSFAQSIVGSQTGYISTPLPRMATYATAFALSLMALPLCLFGFILDITLLAPLTFVHSHLSRFGVSIRIDEVKDKFDYDRTVIVKLWGKEVERKTFQI